MTTDNKCPLCGKSLQENEKLCDDCQNHIDNQYETDFFEETNKQNLNKEERDIRIETEIISINQQVAIVNPDNKKKTSKTLLFIFICCGLIIAFSLFVVIRANDQNGSVELEQQFWDSCLIVNTPFAYAKYLVSFQKGIHSDDAHRRIRNLRYEEYTTWERLRNSNEINDFYNYLSENPNTPYARSARLKMDSLSWNTTVKSNTPEAYLAYLDNVKLGNITGVYQSIAQDKYDYMSQIKLIEGKSLDSIKTLVNVFFTALSDLNQNDLQNDIAPSINIDSQFIKNSDIATFLENSFNEKKIKKLNFQIDKNSIKAIRDNKGITYIDLLVEKKLINTVNKKSSLRDTVKLELNKNNKIQAITLNGFSR